MNKKNNIKTCCHCKTEFETTDSRRVYCSSECQRLGHNEKQNKSRKKPIKTINCYSCGFEFEQTISTQLRCKKCREQNKRIKNMTEQRKKRSHSISVTMEPSRLHIENIGHLAKEKEPESFDVSKHRPNLSNCYKRVVIGKTMYFPRNKEQYEKLLKRLT